MPEIEEITWRQLTGNKFSIALHPAMLHEDGYLRQQRIRKIGDDRKTIFNVVYDREYLIEYVGKTVCRHLFAAGKEKTLDLVSEAWDNYYPNTVRRPVKSAVNR